MVVLSTSTIILEYVCPSLGLITGNIMFFAPFHDTFNASYRYGSLGTLNPTPWIFMLGNCYGWVVYGILLQNLFIYFANAPGFLLSIWLNIQAIKLLYGQYRTTIVRQSIVTALNDASRPFVINDMNDADNNEKNETDKVVVNDDDVENDTTDDVEIANTNGIITDTKNVTTTTITTIPKNENGVKEQNNTTTTTPTNSNSSTSSSGYLIVDYAKIIWDVTAQNTSLPPHHHETAVLVISILWLVITSIVTFGEALSLDTKKLIVGFAVNINLIFFYGAPLSTIYTVLATRNCTTIHIPTMVTNTLNGIFWAAYGFAVMNLFILIPNAIGALTGIIQIVLCFLFPRK